MRISLIHPSRGRPEKSFENSVNWIYMAGTTDVELIISIDSNDSKKETYYDQYRLWRVNNDQTISIIENDNNSVVEATNKAAKQSTGDILLYLSDDFKCPDNWGQLIIKEFENVRTPMLLKVDDCLQKFDVPVLTIPIMNRMLYSRLGYFWHPGYKSMFVDEDLYWTAKSLNALKFAPQLKFPHDHVSVGKAQDDDTYRRSSANWEQGKAFFKQRKAQGFPI